jgi:hypothetical protein
MRKERDCVKAFVQLARIAEIITLGVVITTMTLVVKGWEVLPEYIYAPFGSIEGRWVDIGSKTMLLWMMLGMFFVYLLLSVFMRFHRLYSYPVRIRPANRQNQQLLLKSFFSLLKLELTTILAYSIFSILMCTIRRYCLWADAWLIALVFLILSATVGIYLFLARRYK